MLGFSVIDLRDDFMGQTKSHAVQKDIKILINLVRLILNRQFHIFLRRMGL